MTVSCALFGCTLSPSKKEKALMPIQVGRFLHGAMQ